MRWMITDELWDELDPLVEQAKRYHGGQKRSEKSAMVEWDDPGTTDGERHRPSRLH